LIESFEKVHRNPWITLEFHPAHRHDMHNRIEPRRRVTVHFLAAMVGVKPDYLATTFVEGIWHTRRDRRSLRPFRNAGVLAFQIPWMRDATAGVHIHVTERPVFQRTASCALRGKANEFAEGHLRYVSLAVLDKNTSSTGRTKAVSRIPSAHTAPLVRL